MKGDKVRMKKTYRPCAKLEAFYGGGPVTLNPAGSLVACAYEDETKVVDVPSGKVTKTCPGDGEAVTSLCFTPDGNFLFCASKSQTLRKWNMMDGECTRTWKMHRAAVMNMVVNLTGSVLATGSADRSICVWDVEGGYCTHTFKGHSGVIFKVLFHPSKPLLYSGGDDNDIRVWNLKKKAKPKVLKGHMSAVTSLAFSHDQSTLLSGARDKVVILWDLEKLVQLVTVPVFEAVEGLACLFSRPDVKSKGGKPLVVFATGGERGTVKVWRSDTGEVMAQQQQLVGKHDGGEILALESAPNDGLMTAMADCTLAFWDCEVVENKIALQKKHVLVGNNDEITDLEWVGPIESPSHICVATNSTHLRLFDMASMNCTATMAGHSDAILCTAASRMGDDTTLIVSGSKDNSIIVWEAPSGRPIATGTGHTAAVSCVALSHKCGKFIVTSGADGMIKVWDLASALTKKVSSGERDKLGTLPKLKLKAGALAHSKDVNSIAVAPNDGLLCTGSQDKTAKVFQYPDLVHELTLAGHKRGVWSVQFSPIEKAIVTSSGDKTIKLWSLIDGSCMRTFEGHSAPVLKVSFVTNGLQLLSCGGDALVKLWDVGSSECINTFDEHEDRIWSVKFAGESESKMVTGGSDSVMTIWDDSTVDDEEGEAAQMAEETLKEQKLANALKAKDYRVASKLAFQLQQPAKLLSILKRTNPRDADTSKALFALVQELDEDGLKKCLEYIRDWNTNSRNCHEAQHLLRALLVSFTSKDLTAVSGIGTLLEGLQAYTSRHYSRINRIIQSTYLVDYTLATMNVLVPEVPDISEQVISQGAMGDEEELVNTTKTVQLESDDSDESTSSLKDSKFPGDDLDCKASQSSTMVVSNSNTPETRDLSAARGNEICSDEDLVETSLDEIRLEVDEQVETIENRMQSAGCPKRKRRNSASRGRVESPAKLHRKRRKSL